MHEHILIVDDEAGIRETLGGILEDESYRVTSVDSAAAARAIVSSELFDLAVLDVWLPDGDGIDLLKELKGGQFEPPVIMISGHGNIDSAVKAIRLGAYDFLEKPLSLSRVVLTVGHALEQGRMARELRDLSKRLADKEILIGSSDRMRELKEQLQLAAQSDGRILITGENGTGKELVARQIHRLSERRDHPFVDVNCAAIPEELIESELFGHVRGAFTGATSDRRGRLEQANGGTLFLDEIADMSLKTQAKVLRALEEQRFERVGDAKPIDVDVRVLAATNKKLEEEIADGRFREDLYFRLAVIPLQVPALRERKEDIPLLIEHFLDHYAREVGRPPKRPNRRASERLVDHVWPGNVRELRNLAERLMIMTPGSTITPKDLPPGMGRSTDRRTFDEEVGGLKEARDAFERRFIENKLTQCEGNVTRTAQLLGIERSHLHRKLKSYGIEPDRARVAGGS